MPVIIPQLKKGSKLEKSTFETFIAKNLRHNKVLYIAEGFTSAVWNNLTTTYLLLFINWNWAQYKNLSVESVSNDILGYFQALISLGLFIALLLMTLFSEDLPLKKRVVLYTGGVKRISILLFALATWLLPVKIRLFSVIVIALLFSICGADGIPWRIMYAKVIPPENRGYIEAWRNIMAGIGGLLGLFLAIQIFNSANTGIFARLIMLIPGLHQLEQARYFILFLTLSFFGFISMILIAATREPRDDGLLINQKEQWRNKLQQIRTIICTDHNFRHFLVYLIVGTMADLMMFGYAAVFVRKYLSFGEAIWGELNVIAVLAGMGAMFRWGKCGDEFGWKKVLIKLSVYISSVPLLFIIIANVKLHGLHPRLAGISVIYSFTKNSRQLTVLLLWIAFALLGVFRNSLTITRTYLTLEFRDSKLQTSYLGITMIIQQAAMAIAGLAVGFYIDKLQIPGVILAGIVFHLCAIGYAYFKLKEPRER